jgi:hypothetical protein
MKNIYKILLFFALGSFLFISCNDNEDETALVITPIETAISLSTDTTIQTSLLEEGDAISLTINLSAALPFDVNVTIDAISNDGSTNSGGTEELTYNKITTIVAGTTSANVDVVFNDDTVNDGVETYTLTLSKVVPLDGNFPDYTIIETTGNLSYMFNVENAPITITTIAGNADIVLTWASSSDLDLRLFEGNQDLTNQIDGSFSVAPMETVILPAGSADGEYSLWVEKWPSFSGEEDITVTLTFPSGAPVVFDRKITSDGFFLLVIKETIGTDVNYTFETL